MAWGSPVAIDSLAASRTWIACMPSSAVTGGLSYAIAKRKPVPLLRQGKSFYRELISRMEIVHTGFGGYFSTLKTEPLDRWRKAAYSGVFHQDIYQTI